MTCHCGARIDTPGATACWRHRRRKAIAPRRGGTRRPDAVEPGTYARVRHRDGWGCVGVVVGFPMRCQGPIELDHVLTGGLGLRGISCECNLASLCTGHHRWKTEHATRARALLLDYLRRSPHVIHTGPHPDVASHGSDGVG